MTTWIEAREAKRERLKREARFYTPDKLEKPCTDCNLKLPKVLSDLGYNTHPTCGRESAWIMQAAK